MGIRNDPEHGPSRAPARTYVRGTIRRLRILTPVARLSNCQRAGAALSLGWAKNVDLPSRQDQNLLLLRALSYILASNGGDTTNQSAVPGQARESARRL